MPYSQASGSGLYTTDYSTFFVMFSACFERIYRGVGYFNSGVVGALSGAVGVYYPAA